MTLWSFSRCVQCIINKPLMLPFGMLLMSYDCCCVPHSAFSFFRESVFCEAVGWLETNFSPPQLNRKVICLLNWGEREFGTAVLTGCQDYRWDWQRANRTCLSIMKEKKSKKEGEMQRRTFKESQMDGHCYVISMWRWMMTEVDSSEIKNGKLMGECGHEPSTTPFMQCSLFSENNTD